MAEYTTGAAQMVPHTREAEEGLLGAVMINADAYDTVQYLEPEDFYIHRNRYVWRAIKELREEKAPIDLITLVNKIDNNDHLAEIGGSAYLTKIMNNVPSSLNADRYAEDILDDAVRRGTLADANSLAKLAYDKSQDIVDGRARVADSLLTTRGDGGALPIKDLLSRGWDMLEEVQLRPELLAPLSTGLTDLDAVLGGGLYPGMSMLVAETGLGKSILVQQIASNIAQNNTPIAFYAGEMHWQDMYLRMMGDWGNLKVSEMRRGEINWDRVADATDKFSELPLYFDDPKHMTTAELRADLTKLKRKYNLQAMVLDFLDDLKDEEGRMEDWRRSALLATRVQAMCKDLGIRGLVVHEVTKEGQSDPSKAGIAGDRKVAYRAICAVQMLPFVKSEGEMTRDDYNMRSIKNIKQNRLAENNQPWCDLYKDPEYPRFQNGAR